MKRHLLASIAIFLCLLIFGILLFNLLETPSADAAALLTTTPSHTPTETVTLTPTATSTTEPCASPPPAPQLGKPKDGKDFSPVSQKVKLVWKTSACALTYRYKVFRDSKDGELVSRKKGMQQTSIMTQVLSPGHTYYWYAQACNAAGCTRSKYRDFRIPPPATSRPRPTTAPKPTSTPAAPPPNSIANFQGPSVYLDTTEPVYYFDCGWKWRQMGDIILIIAVGFDPGEQVFMRAYEISSGVTSATGDYIAASNGWVNTAINTSAWAGGHFHVIFDGESSNASECGHFDLDHGPAGAARTDERALRGPH